MKRLLALLLCIVALGIAPGAGLRDSSPEIPDVHFSQSEKSKRRKNRPVDQAAADGASDSDWGRKLCANCFGVSAAACSAVGLAGRRLITSAK